MAPPEGAVADALELLSNRGPAKVEVVTWSGLGLGLGIASGQVRVRVKDRVRVRVKGEVVTPRGAEVRARVRLGLAHRGWG